MFKVQNLKLGVVMGWLFMAVALGNLVGGIRLYSQQVQQCDWVLTEAVVTDVSQRIRSSGTGRHSSSTTYYYADYLYTVDGTDHTGTTGGSVTYRVTGETLQVKYDPQDPSLSTEVLAPQTGDLFINLGACLLFGVLGFFMSGLPAKLKKKRKQS